MRVKLSLQDYVDGINQRNVTILARAISLVESTNSEHRELASQLLEKINVQKKAKIIGISGTPGVGKSTFIDTFGTLLLGKGLKIAVLAIDPSSVKTGGSILGDKTRMYNLASHTNAFIRPSAAGKTLGGVAAKTRESILLCEAFGFDVIIVETVGVGQSELTVSQMVDFFLLLMQPGSGDDLQGIKRGILEVCHMVAVNKADGELLNKANIAKSEYEMALRILRKHESYQPKVFTCSALKATGLDTIWEEIVSFWSSQDIESNRKEQMKGWFDSLVEANLVSKLRTNTIFCKERDQLLVEMVNQGVSIVNAADKVVKKVFAGDYNER